MHGNGRVLFPDGRTFEGGFIRNLPNGHGTLKARGASVAEGKWKEGLLVQKWEGQPPVLQNVCEGDDGADACSIALPPLCVDER